MHYQPQIRTIDGAIHGVEALARWHDPVLGEVSPAKFIPLAEECGLIEQIGLWSIREACRQMAEWRDAGLDIPCVSVNLSPINFQNVNLAAAVAEILADHGLPPEVLMLEITEGVIMNERSVAIETMNAIRRLGVGLSLDDFGTGYSSLSRLAHLPIRELKIDRSFMRDIESDASARAIVTTVVRVGQSLQLTVVAEGVETEGQRKLLAELGCDVVQGFLYAPALSPAAFGRWLLDHSASRASVMLRRIGRSLPRGRVFAPRSLRRAAGIGCSRSERRGGKAERLHHVVGRLRQRHGVVDRERAERRGPGQADADRGAHDVGVGELQRLRRARKRRRPAVAKHAAGIDKGDRLQAVFLPERRGCCSAVPPSSPSTCCRRHYPWWCRG